MDRVAKIGRQVLEALAYLQDVDFPYGQLHSGNVLIENGNCRSALGSFFFFVSLIVFVLPVGMRARVHACLFPVPMVMIV